MRINISNFLVDNDLSREELLKNVEVQHTTFHDALAICKVLAHSFDLSSTDEAIFQMLNSRMNLQKSVKLVDKDTGDIYGLLMLADYNINNGSPLPFVSKEMALHLSQLTQVNGHSFIIDKRLRGTGLDKKMVEVASDAIKGKYDFIWVAVERDLKSHKYWQRMGFVKLFSIPEASFYVRPLR